jgi:hypothetical protein
MKPQTIILGVAITILGVAAAAVTIRPQPTVAAQQQTIPAQFWGKWDSDLESCRSPVSEGRLVISADRVEFYESRGSVRDVVTRGNSDLELTMELFGEGETWTSDKYFRLSDDLKSLTDLTNGEPGFVRYRCP